MTATTTIVGIPGSTRKASLNAALLRAVARAMPDGITVDIVSIADIPLYDGDRESAEGVPEVVERLKSRIADAAGLLIASPEYNGSVPGVLKNAIDWLSRPAHDIKRVFGGKPTATIGATNGPGGTIMAQAAWLQVLARLGSHPFFGGRLAVPFVIKSMSGDEVTDPELAKRIKTFAEGFASFVAAAAPKAPA
jgi:chromate reductase